MKRLIWTSLIMILVIGQVVGQVATIIMKNGEQMEAEVLRMSHHGVEVNPVGDIPFLILPKTRIEKIRLENGSSFFFNESLSPMYNQDERLHYSLYETRYDFSLEELWDLYDKYGSTTPLESNELGASVNLNARDYFYLGKKGKISFNHITRGIMVIHADGGPKLAYGLKIRINSFFFNWVNPAGSVFDLEKLNWQVSLEDRQGRIVALANFKFSDLVRFKTGLPQTRKGSAVSLGPYYIEPTVIYASPQSENAFLHIGLRFL